MDLFFGDVQLVIQIFFVRNPDPTININIKEGGTSENEYVDLNNKNASC